jgi:hypothetical protein
MDPPAFISALQGTALAGLVRGDQAGGEWLFPIVETFHVLALATVFGSIAMVDLRLLGLSSRNRAVSKLSEEVLPWTWVAFLVAALSGSLLFISKAESYWFNTQFQLKFLCMLLAGLNMLAFQFGIYRRVAQWDSSLPAPLAARFAGAASLCLWLAVIVFGRWIGFTT